MTETQLQTTQETRLSILTVLAERPRERLVTIDRAFLLSLIADAALAAEYEAALEAQAVATEALAEDLEVLVGAMEALAEAPEAPNE